MFPKHNKQRDDWHCRGNRPAGINDSEVPSGAGNGPSRAEDGLGRAGNSWVE